MSLSVFFTNVGDIIEGIEKRLGIADNTAKESADAMAATLSTLTTKLMSDELTAVGKLAEQYVAGVVADPSTFVAASEKLAIDVAAATLSVVKKDVLDVFRVKVIAAS